MLTCAHCGEPIDHADGVWFHPYRRFRSENGSLPTLCDYGDRVGPTHATPVAVTQEDREFLHSNHILADDESFLLEALWLDWQHANMQAGSSRCVGCGAAPRGQHALDCRQRAPMNFDRSIAHLRHATHH